MEPIQLEETSYLPVNRVELMLQRNAAGNFILEIAPEVLPWFVKQLERPDLVVVASEYPFEKPIDITD